MARSKIEDWQMKQDSVHSKGKSLGQSQGMGKLGKTSRTHTATVASSIAKPEFKKHIHTNNAKNKIDDSAGAASGEVLSRRQLKNLAKRRKKEAAAAAASPAEANGSSSSPSLHPSNSNSSSVGNTPTSSKAKKAPLDPGKKAEVNCNWQALKKALVSGGPLITGSVRIICSLFSPSSCAATSCG